jgi:hypothetical protein
MGLDMYLKANKYIGGWEHTPEDERKLYSALREATGVTPIYNSPVFAVTATVGYWRKANAIHRWFVENVQDGEDNCRDYYVSREQLMELRDLCQKALDKAQTVEGEVCTGVSYSSEGRKVLTQSGKIVTNPEAMEELLPTQEGFFFGSTEYDEFYLQDLRDTIEIVNRVLSDPALKGWDFEYRSSW